jgi:MATE family multidrug resistance protein
VTASAGEPAAAPPLRGNAATQRLRYLMPLTQFKQESRALVRLASPIILSQIAFVLMGLADTVMSGHAGATEQAVVGLGVALWIPVFIALMSVVQAVSPLIAHHFGAGDRAAVAREAREGIWLALFAGLVPLALVPWAPSLLMWFDIEPALAARTGVFLWGIGLGLPAALVYRALTFYSASINQTRPIMVIAFLGLGINAFLNWVLIYGHFGLPAMGGAGCGWATGIGMWVSLIAFVAWTARAPAYKPYYLWRAWALPSWAAQKQLLRLGCPWAAPASPRWRRSPAWPCSSAASAKCRSPRIRLRSTSRRWCSCSRWASRRPSPSASATRWERAMRRRHATARGPASRWG